MKDLFIKKRENDSVSYFIIRQQQYINRREAHLLVFIFYLLVFIF